MKPWRRCQWSRAVGSTTTRTVFLLRAAPRGFHKPHGHRDGEDNRRSLLVGNKIRPSQSQVPSQEAWRLCYAWRLSTWAVWCWALHSDRRMGNGPLWCKAARLNGWYINATLCSGEDRKPITPEMNSRTSVPKLRLSSSLILPQIPIVRYCSDHR